MKSLKWIVLLLAVPTIAMLFTGCKCEDEELIIPTPIFEDHPVLLGTTADRISIGELIELTNNQVVAFSDPFEKIIYLNFAFYEIVQEHFQAIEEGSYWLLPEEEGSTDAPLYTILPFEEVNLEMELTENNLLSVKGFICEVREPTECAQLIHNQEYYSPKNKITVCTVKEGAVCSFIWKETDVTIYKDANCSEVDREAKILLARCIL